MAACIGAANAFKISLGLPQSFIRGTFSLWSFGRNGQALQGPPLVATDLGDVLLVGHDPSFSILLHDLTGAQARMKKGGLAAINKGELVMLVRPSELAAIAPANAPVVTG